MPISNIVFLHCIEKDSLLVLPLVHKVGCMRAIHDRPVCLTIKKKKMSINISDASWQLMIMYIISPLVLWYVSRKRY